MQISISGKNMDTGLAFQEHAELSLNNIVEKYFNNAVSAMFGMVCTMTFRPQVADQTGVACLAMF